MKIIILNFGIRVSKFDDRKAHTRESERSGKGSLSTTN
jgi:hypothetical protein